MGYSYGFKLFGGGGTGGGVGTSTNTQVLFNSSGTVAGDAGLTYDAATDTLTVMGPLYTYATGAQAFSNGSAVLLQSQLTKASSVFGVYVDTTHNSNTGDVYGLLANAAKGAGKLGKVLAVEGYASFPHQGDNSTHYGITGDVRADANGKSGTLNVGAWALAAGAATDIGLLVSTVPNESGLPASGDYAIYSGDSNYEAFIAGPVTVGGVVRGSKSKALTAAAATGFVEIALTDKQAVSGDVIYEVYAADATDCQSLAGVLRYSATNKGGTVTATVSEVGTQTLAVTLGGSTLTATNDYAVAADKVTLRCNAASSLTETTLEIRYRIDSPNTNAITPL